MSVEKLVLGIDVGTGSARAGIFDLSGRKLGHATESTETSQPRADFFEQSSEDIWAACGRAVRGALERADVPPESVGGMSFDATSCSLVAIDAAGEPVTVSAEGDDRWNVILWMDHRAMSEADLANTTGHEVLKYVGGTISPEMAPPKLLWIKRNLPETWRRTARFIDLADYLVFRSTDNDVRSMCTTVCKWTYLGHRESGGWARDFFTAIDLDDLFEGDRQGTDVRPMGALAGGLTSSAAEQLGLVEGIPVGVGIIDAHAGGVGMLGAAIADDSTGASREARLERALAIIGGTSSCHMAVSRKPRFLPGIWGPYYSAMIPGMWLTEGGQCSTGSLVDHVIDDAAATPELRRLASEKNVTPYEILNAEVACLAHDRGVPPGELTRDLHTLPYFLGNRSPRADSSLRGVVSGLGLDGSLAALALRYLSAIQGIALGTRHIIEELNAGGYDIDTVLICGGGTKNPLWLQQHADITGCRLHLPEEPEAVLLGTAILGAVAAGCFTDILSGSRAMGRSAQVIEADPATSACHDRKYRVFQRMYEHFMELRDVQ